MSCDETCLKADVWQIIRSKNVAMTAATMSMTMSAAPETLGDSCRAVAVFTAQDLVASDVDGLVIFMLEKGTANPADLFKLVADDNIAENLETSGLASRLSLHARCKVAKITVQGTETSCRVFARVQKST